MSKKRETGYYWCRLVNDWSIGYYCQGGFDQYWGFAFNGGDGVIDENFLDEIDENIILRKGSVKDD